MSNSLACVLFLITAAAPVSANVVPSTPVHEQESALEGVEKIRIDAEALEHVVESALGWQFLNAAKELPAIETGRVVYWNRALGKAMTSSEAEVIDEAAREGFQEVPVSEQLYYNTFYGSPLGYLRAIDLLGANGIDSVDGLRVLDFGYGGIGHLRSLASLGADVVGIEVQDLLRAMYSEPGDTGSIPRAETAGAGEAGSLNLFYGSFPGEDSIRESVGVGFDLIMSKNVLKKGYIHPEREADPRQLIDLGVDDATFLGAIHEALAPGGLFLIYNLYPKQNPLDQPYIPWATGDCPFDRETVDAAGLDIVVWNWNDTAGAHRMGRGLRWDRDPAERDLSETLFATLTLLKRRNER